MDKAFFKVIVPNYNNSVWLSKSLGSIFDQTFKDFKIIFIDDVSTDNSLDIAEAFKLQYPDKIEIIASTKKLWNGGSRNIGIKSTSFNSEYTIFLDSDDWFCDPDCFSHIYNCLAEQNFPDILRLSYVYKDEAQQFPVILNHQNTLELLTQAPEVACWTKVAKTSIMPLFPENTLMEDVIQHMKLLDIATTITSTDKPIVIWNRTNTNSCSRPDNQLSQQGKWQSSMFRFVADLMDFHPVHNYVETNRQYRLHMALENIKQGKYIQ